MTGPAVLVEREGAVCTITLNRPERLNAFTLEMEAEYLAALVDAGRDPEVGAIVVTGAGRGFCSGADTTLLRDLDADRAARQRVEAGRLHVGTTIRKPVIAAVNGVAAGIGMVHALVADLRVASEDATFVPAFARLGLVAEAGVAWLLPRLVGSSRALAILWSTESVTSARALEIGMVDEVVAPGRALARAQELAAGLVSAGSAYSRGHMKTQVLRGWSQTLDEAVDLAEQLTHESLGRDELRTALDLRSGAAPTVGG